MFDLEERVKALRDGPHAGYERGQRLAVRIGEDLSSLRNCCSANCQNSASRSSGWPACPQSLYARASISCLFGSGIMIAPGFGARSRLSGGVGLIARTVPDQLGDWTADSSPHEAASSSGRLAHKTQAMLALPWPLPGLSRSSRARTRGAWQASAASTDEISAQRRDAVNETITAPLAGRLLRRCSAIMVLSRVHKLLRDANLPELHLFNSRRSTFRADTKSKER